MRPASPDGGIRQFPTVGRRAGVADRRPAAEERALHVDSGSGVVPGVLHTQAHKLNSRLVNRSRADHRSLGYLSGALGLVPLVGARRQIKIASALVVQSQPNVLISDSQRVLLIDGV